MKKLLPSRSHHQWYLHETFVGTDRFVVAAVASFDGTIEAADTAR
jgi:hypothetical protein